MAHEFQPTNGSTQTVYGPKLQGHIKIVKQAGFLLHALVNILLDV
jgi:hypothetical protein